MLFKVKESGSMGIVNNKDQPRSLFCLAVGSRCVRLIVEPALNISGRLTTYFTTYFTVLPVIHQL